MATRVRTLLAALALVAAPAAAHAQGEGIPFRAGQWAVELSGPIGGVAALEEFASAGFLRFTSPSGAWFFAPGIIFSSGDIEANGSESETSAFGFDLRVGRRSYRALGRGTAAYFGLGVEVQRLSLEEEDAGETFEETQMLLGLFGEIGGTYFFSPRFGLGASMLGTLGYQTLDVDTSFGATAEGSNVLLAFPQTRLHVTIAF